MAIVLLTALGHTHSRSSASLALTCSAPVNKGSGVSQPQGHLRVNGTRLPGPHTASSTPTPPPVEAALNMRKEKVSSLPELNTLLNPLASILSTPVSQEPLLRAEDLTPSLGLTTATSQALCPPCRVPQSWSMRPAHPGRGLRSPGSLKTLLGRNRFEPPLQPLMNPAQRPPSFL